MKFSELAKYCEEIDIDCDICTCTENCKNYFDYIEDRTPAGILELVKSDEMDF